MTTPADVLNVYRSLIGTTEDPRGSNHNLVTEWFADVGGDEWEWCRRGQPWCAMTGTYALWFALLNEDFYAYCPSWVNAFRARGRWYSFDDAEPGDIGFADWDGDGIADHVFIIEALDGNYVYTIEGNTGGPNGAPDGVWRCRRHRSVIEGVGRPGYVGAIQVAPEAPGTPAEYVAPPSATLGRAILRKGVKGVAVRGWQQGLLAAGLMPAGHDDGDFGDETDAATRALQRQMHVTDDGEVGPQTWAAYDRLIAYLVAVAAAAANPTVVADAIPPFPGTVRLGSTGAAVTQVQQRLADRGWAIAVDGSFGRKTESVVKQYQAEKGLVADGEAGPRTWLSLCTDPVT